MSNILKEYKLLQVEIIRTPANTTAYQIKQTQGAEHGDEAYKVQGLFERSLKCFDYTMDDVIEYFFKNEKTKYFHQSDYHKRAEGDTFIRYVKQYQIVELWYGSDNGETMILASSSADIVCKLLWAVMHNR